MHKHLLILILGCLSSWLHSQDLKWLYSAGGSQADYGSGVSIDSKQNICDIIVFQDTISISINEKIGSKGAENVIIRKSTALGIRQWYYTLSTKNRVLANDIITDKDDNTYVTGIFIDSLFYNSNFVLKGSPTIPNSFIIKIDENGHLLWAREFTSDTSITAKSLSLNLAKDVYISGHYEGNADFNNGFKSVSAGSNDIFITKLDKNGNTLLAKSIGGTDQDYISQHVLDKDDNIYLTGDFRGNIIISQNGKDTELVPSGLTDIFLIKLSPIGDLIWAKSYGGSGIDAGLSLTLDTKDNIILTGRFSQMVSFGKPELTVQSKGGTDIFLVKLDSSGTEIWVNTYGNTQNDSGVKVITNHFDIIFLGGTFKGKVDFNPSVSLSNSSESKGNSDIFYAIYNQDGTYNQHFSLGGLADEQLGGMALLITGDLISTGGFGGVVDFDPTSNESNIFSNGGLDAYLISNFICINPYIKSIKVAKNIICPGENILIQIEEGYLNSATQWSWQRNKCDNITFASGDFLNIQIDTSTIFYVKGFGGCVNHDQCKKIDIKIFQDSIVNQNIVLCEGDTLKVGLKNYTTSGTYRDTLISTGGCDSIIISEVVVFPKYFISQNIEICNGDSIKVGPSAYTLPGSYTNNLLSINGCDSIVVTNLTILPATIEHAEAIICKGDKVIIQGEEYDHGGIFIKTTPNPSGCENMLIVNIIELETEFNVNANICDGESYTVNDKIYTESGIYIDSLKSSYGCDSIITTQLSIHQHNDNYLDYIFCVGDSITINGHVYKDRAYIIDSLQNISGCDSIVYTSIDTYQVTPLTSQDINLCQGDTLYVGTFYYTQAGIYIDTLNNSNGCDSIIHTNITVMPKYFDIEESICEGETFTVGNKVFTNSGAYAIPFISSIGCDSIIRLSLTVFPIIEKAYLHKICPGEHITIGNHDYDTPGIFVDTLSAISGCDSIVTSTIVFNHVTRNLSYDICDGETITINNKKYNITGTYTDSLTTNRGCDSVLIIKIAIHPKITIDTLFEICKGDGIKVGNSTYYNAGKYREALSSQFGCDSIINFEIEIINFIPSISFSKDTLKTIKIDGAKYQWYICKDNEQIPILGATNSSLEVAASGNYAIAVTYKGCTYFSVCLYVNTTSTYDEAGNTKSLKLYPNPVIEILTVEVPEHGILRITSPTGIIYREQSVRAGKVEIDANNLISGTYILECQSSNKLYRSIFVKI